METVKSNALTAFKAGCLWVIRKLGRYPEPVTIARRGHPVAVLTPLPVAGKPTSIIGAMQGSVLYYDAPFEPSVDPNDWAIFR